MTVTACAAYLQYDLESTFGGGGNSVNKVFGLDQKISGLSRKNNQIPLTQLGSPEIQSFAYGKDEGGMSVDYILSNPWFFSWIFGDPVSAVAGSAYTHTWNSSPSINATICTATTGNIEIGVDTDTNVIRITKGVIAKSINLKTALNDTVKGSMSFEWGKEDALSTSLDSTPASDDILFPYTFAHATLELPNGTTIAQIQDFDITFNPNTELLWGVGSVQAVSAVRKVFEMTGRFSASYLNSTLLAKLIAREEYATLQITFTNGLTGANEKSIVINATGVGISEHSNPTIAAGEVIFEDISFQWRSCQIIATNAISAQP